MLCTGLRNAPRNLTIAALVENCLQSGWRPWKYRHRLFRLHTLQNSDSEQIRQRSTVLRA